MTTGGVEAVFVTVMVPLAFVTTRIGATTTRPVPAVRTVDVDTVVDDDVVVGAVRRRLPSGGLAVRVGLGVTDDVSVGVRTFVPAATVGVVAIAAVVGVNVVLVDAGVVLIAAVVGVAVVFASVGVVVIAAVAGVAVVLASVGVVVIAAVVGVAVVAAIVGATVVPAVEAAVVPVELKTTPPPPSPVTTGIGSELMDAFTVACGLA